MKPNKTTTFVLLHLLNGADTAAAVQAAAPELELRTVQRALERLTELGLLIRHGTNHPRYDLNYEQITQFTIDQAILEHEERPNSQFHYEYVAWLNSLSKHELDTIFGKKYFPAATAGRAPKMSPKDLEYLTVELSWKSSALEGNTYSLLDTQLLLTEGIQANNRTEFETQMILNHKDTIAFIIGHPEAFTTNISFATLEALHKIIGHNLGIAPGMRQKAVRISASNYVPIGNPHQLREYADTLLALISRPTNPYARTLLALALIPYLQIFEDGNKRTGRLLANAILISTIGRGFSLRQTDRRQLALAYLAFYEFNSMHQLATILQKELDN